MNISLTPKLEQFIQEKLNTGLYTSASEVIRESLRIMHEYESIKHSNASDLNAKVRAGLEDVEQGSVIPAEESHKKLQAKIKKIGQKSK